MFKTGESYSPYKICLRLGGSHRQNLPLKSGKVTVIFVPKIVKERNLPLFLEVYSKPKSIEAVESLIKEGAGKHTFLRIDESTAEYLGIFKAGMQTYDSDEISYYKYSKNHKIHSLLFFEEITDLAPVQKAPIATAPAKPKAEKALLPRSKVCKKCKDQKTALEFFKSPRNSDGLTKWCRSCLRA